MESDNWSSFVNIFSPDQAGLYWLLCKLLYVRGVSYFMIEELGPLSVPYSNDQL